MAGEKAPPEARRPTRKARPRLGSATIPPQMTKLLSCPKGRTRHGGLLGANIVRALQLQHPRTHVCTPLQEFHPAHVLIPDEKPAEICRFTRTWSCSRTWPRSFRLLFPWALLINLMKSLYLLLDLNSAEASYLPGR